MKINNLSIEQIRTEAIDIIAKAYLELGQNPDEDTMVQMSLSLAEDLQKDFNKLEIQDIKEAFRIGIRETEVFHITVKTYYKWIKDHQQIIWNNETIPEQQQDKRLQYRSRNGTGMKRIDINKTKLIK
tara:strand:+ start:2584 stop:2967 length:384 start_codon:yes stop_codon:yes gene_type:complete